MADRRSGGHTPEQPSDDPALALAARHALHDEELVAAYAAGAADDEEAPRAGALIDRCPTCADLAADIAAIAAATQSLRDDTLLGAVPAPRDFRLTIEDARRLRPDSPVRAGRRFLGDLGRLLRPLGATFATFGLVGLLVGTVSLGPMGGPLAAGPAAPVDQAASSAPVRPGSGGHAPAATAEAEIKLTPEETGREFVAPPPVTDLGEADGLNAGVLLAGSTALLVVGIALVIAGSGRRGKYLDVRHH